jgi:hypothetical protein
MFLVYWCRKVKLFGWLAGVPPERTRPTSTEDQTSSHSQDTAVRKSLPIADSITLQEILESSVNQQEEQEKSEQIRDQDAEKQDLNTTVPDDDSKTTAREEEEAVQWKKILRSVRRCRIAVIFVTTMMLVFSGLTLGIAIPGLNILIGSVQQDVPAVLNLVNASNTATYSYLQSLRTIELSRIEIIGTSHEDCNLSDDNALYLLNNTLSNTSFPEMAIALLNGSPFDLTKDVERIDDTLSLVDGWWYWVMGALIVALDIIAILFLTGTILVGAKSNHDGLD